MAIERTFSIIKPDATARNRTGAINAMIEQAGLRIVAQKRLRITRDQAETFYGVHRARPFFGELVEYMTSGPVLLTCLAREDAVSAVSLPAKNADSNRQTNTMTRDSQSFAVIVIYRRGTCALRRGRYCSR